MPGSFGGSAMRRPDGAVPSGTQPRSGLLGGLWVGLLLLALLAGCAAMFERTTPDGQGRFRHRVLDYSIDRPSVLALPGWTTVQFEESDFAVRQTDGSSFALASNCRATKASPRQLAFQMMRASRAKPVGPGEELEQAGLPGFAQDLERVEGSAWIRIRTLTLRGARCTYDWILLAPDAERLAALRPAFDAWWQSFVPAPVEREQAASR